MPWIIKKESHRTMKLFSRRTDNVFHNSRKVAMCPTNLVHGIAGTKSSARYDSPVSDLKSQLGYAQDLGRGPLRAKPVVWPEEKRREALREYLRDSMQAAQVQTEITNYKYFCGMPDGKSVKSQFCYLRQRLLALTANGELAQLSVAKSEQNEFLEKLGGLFGKDETNPSEEQIASNAKPMADEDLFGKFLYFVQMDGMYSFPAFSVSCLLHSNSIFIIC